MQSQEGDRDQPVLQTPFLLWFREGSEVPKVTQHTAAEPNGVRAQSGHSRAPPHSSCPSPGALPGPWARQYGHCWAALGSGLSLEGRCSWPSDSAFCSQGACRVFSEAESLTPAQHHGPCTPSPTTHSLCLSLDVQVSTGCLTLRACSSRRGSFLPSTPSLPTHTCFLPRGKWLGREEGTAAASAGR